MRYETMRAIISIGWTLFILGFILYYVFGPGSKENHT